MMKLRTTVGAGMLEVLLICRSKTNERLKRLHNKLWRRDLNRESKQVQTTANRTLTSTVFIYILLIIFVWLFHGSEGLLCLTKNYFHLKVKLSFVFFLHHKVAMQCCKPTEVKNVRAISNPPSQCSIWCNINIYCFFFFYLQETKPEASQEKLYIKKAQRCTED